MCNNKFDQDSEEIMTTDLFWDCECGEDYIHPKTETKWPKCGWEAEDSPDSHISEVIENPPVRCFIEPPADKYGNVGYGRVVIEAQMVLQESGHVSLRVLRPDEFKAKWPTVSPLYFIPVTAEPGELTWQQYRDLIVSIPDLPEWMYAAFK